MALEHIDHAGTPTRAGIIFPMTDGSKTVAIIVTDEVLQDIDPGTLVDNKKDRLAEHRNRIEEIARGKYAGDDRVTISTDDL
jgi:Protein of unknown function (DUF1488)